MKPLIAITCGEIHNQVEPWSPLTHGQSYTYITSIINAGGTPFLVPLVEEETVLRQLYNLADGILFAGGNDPHPSLYNQQPYVETIDTSPLRDRVEMKLIHWALEDRKPSLGICRGMQLFNIARGGTLYQDIPTDLPEMSDHNSSTKRQSLVDIAHALRIKEDTQLHALLGLTTIGTNTHHHQALHQLGKGIIPTAWSEDGLIEAIEIERQKFAIGVQSHPESLESTVEPGWQKLFRGLVLATQ